MPDETRDLIRSMALRKVGTEVRLTLAWLAFYDRTMFLIHTLPAGETPYDAED